MTAESKLYDLYYTLHCQLDNIFVMLVLISQSSFTHLIEVPKLNTFFFVHGHFKHVDHDEQ